LSFQENESAALTGLAASGGVLTVDLDALSDNYRRVARLVGSAKIGCLIKANAYGLGLAPVAHTLAAAGCTTFFVAEAPEGVALRRVLPGTPIYVLNGLFAHAASFYRAHDLRPCLSSLEEIADWSAEAGKAGKKLQAALHFDTGLNRLGIPAYEAEKLISQPTLLEGIEVDLVMSHLACADEPSHPQNAVQLARFQKLRAHFPKAKASLANSAGVFLGPDYHFDLVRPGIGIFGGNPFSSRENPFAGVAHVEARILQIRDVADGDSVGYGATYKARGPLRLAVLSAGYGDGYFRALGSAGGTGGRVWLKGHYAPVAGRISMDMTSIDITHMPVGLVQRGDLAELVGPHVSIDELGLKAGTIGYEMLTSLGARYARLYTQNGRITDGSALTSDEEQT
jgi:alanine racemase